MEGRHFARKLRSGRARGAPAGVACFWILLLAVALAFPTDAEARRRKGRRASKAAAARPAAAAKGDPKPSATASPKAPTVPRFAKFDDVVLGLAFDLPADFAAAPPTPPVNLILRAPPSPPFRTNVSILLAKDEAPLPKYLEAQAKGAATPPKPLEGAAPGGKLAGRPAAVLVSEFAHQDLKLTALSAILDDGPTKITITATLLTERLPAFRPAFDRLLATLAVKKREPLPGKPGAEYRDVAGRFALTLPRRFGAVLPRSPELASFVGPVEAGIPITGRVEKVAKHKYWAATKVWIETIRGGVPGDETAKTVRAGEVLKRPGQPDAILLETREMGDGREIFQVVLETDEGKQVWRLAFRGPSENFELYAPALKKSAATFVVPASPAK